MAARKFGTFSGVFTPSILTILGVIMFLRLPSIVGQAGLWTTLGIIAVAHIISFTTGLSVASVATDRRVQAGGTYYMVSRSLGLPIGGTLGLALFVGLSFSVSLYVIGFAESFLGYWGRDITIDGIRVTGGIVLAAVAGITLVSTSLALRAQFFIMAAIALALLSVVFGRHDMAPTAPLLEAAADAAPFIVLFGIFFPAVTGFEAGVSMSGDLRDAKKSLPAGTIWAIAVGFLVYVGLAVFFASTVSREQLVGNPRVLLEISLFPPLVALGIWGATISSALGSILGAPRILQAVSADGITPRFFARGYGRNNEPRRALLLTFAIALVGVLIGELDVIARIVSMFFITTYGFLNLGCAIESWASPDFRPSFRIPRWVSLLGALACLIVMIQLDIIAMIGATLVLGGLYVYLARRQLTLEAGDAWQGFWASVVRAALHRLDRRPGHPRNWRPNVILFAGAEGARPHLLSLARHVAGRRGVVSSFDLVERPDGRSDGRPVPLPRDPRLEMYGVFTRRVECADVYAGMESVARFHGFSGVEPNTVLMGWGRKSRAPERFVGLIRSLAAQDYNLLLLDWDPDRGFGERRRIDVWWRGASGNVGLALALARYLTASDEWRGAEVRFLTVNERTRALSGAIHRDMTLLLEDARLAARVEVLDNAVEGRPFAGIVAAESADADLTLLGLPDPRGADGGAFVAQTNGILNALGTTLLLRAASTFEPAVAGPGAVQGAEPAGIAALEPDPPLAPLPPPPLNGRFAVAADGLDQELQAAAERYIEATLEPAFAASDALVREAAAAAAQALESVRGAGAAGRPRALRAVRKAQGDVLYHARRVLAVHREAGHARQRATLEAGVDWFLGQAPALAGPCVERLDVELEPARFRSLPGAGPGAAAYRTRVLLRARLRGRPAVHTIPLRALVRRHLDTGIPDLLEAVLRAVAEDAARAVADAQQLLAHGRDGLDRIERAVGGGEADAFGAVAADVAAVEAAAADARAVRAAALQRARAAVRLALRAVVEAVGADAARADVASRSRTPGGPAHARALGAAARETPARWSAGHVLLLRSADTELQLLALQNRIRAIAGRSRAELRLGIQNGLLGRVRATADALAAFADRVAREPGATFARAAEPIVPFDGAPFVEGLHEDLRAAVAELPAEVDAPSAACHARLEAGEPIEPDVVRLAIRGIAGFRIDTELIGPVQDALARAAPALDAAADAAQDAIRLAGVRLDAGDGEAGDGATTRVQVLNEAEARIRDAHDAALAAVAGLDADIERHVHRTCELLSPWAVTRSTTALPQYLRAQRSRAAASWLRRRAGLARAWAAERVTRVLYQRSETVLLTREMQARSADAPQARLLSVVASVSPRADVLAALPFHYQQLFLGRPGFARDAWVGWRVERQEAAQIVDGWRRGFGGALLVTGEAYAGKTSLLHALVEEHFADAPRTAVAPPPCASPDPSELLARLRDAARSADPDPLAALPDGAVVLFDDLDLWWERTPGGGAALEVLGELLDRHAGRLRILMAADTHAWGLIRRTIGLDGQLLGVVPCRPFSARQVGEVIRFRHGSTGMVFEYDGRAEHELSDWRRARLFNRLFDHARGNIGVALRAWIRHIERVEDRRLTIGRPAPPRLEPLEALAPLQQLLLVHLALHRACAADRLHAAAGLARRDLDRELGPLRRVGIVTERAPGILALDPFLRPHLMPWLAGRGLLP